MAAAPRSNIKFLLNGREVVVESPDPRTTVLEYVRAQRLTGTKLVCGEGGCGACTVLVTRMEGGEVRHRSVNACMSPLCAMDGCHVTTVEGVGSATDPHPIQERLAKMHGSQCGFCTPGIVMALYTKLAECPTPTAAEIEDSLDGNLCRCTGYRPILDAAKTFASDAASALPSPACQACPNRGTCAAGAESVLTTTRSKAVEPRKDEQWSVRFEPEGKHKAPELPTAISALTADTLHIEHLAANGVTIRWIRPTTVHDFLAAKRDFPDAKIINGNTEVAIETKIRGLQYPTLLTVAAIPELTSTKMEGGTLMVGAGVTLTGLLERLRKVGNLDDSTALKQPSVFAALRRVIAWFASTAVRNAAAVGGNLCTASPIGDLLPMLMSCGAELEVGSVAADGKMTLRRIPAREWVVGYRKTTMAPTEALVTVHIPEVFNTEEKEEGVATYTVANAYKQSRRREDDISIVTTAFVADISCSGKTMTVTRMAAAAGGVAPMTLPVDAVAAAVVGATLPISAEVRAKINAAVKETLHLAPNVPGGMPAYRMTLVASMCQRFLFDAERYVRQQASASPDATTSASGDAEADAATTVDGADCYMTKHRPLTHGLQRYARQPEGGCLTDSKIAPSDVKYRGAIGEPVAHRSAILQSTGRAQYLDDTAPVAGMLHAALVVSDRPTGSFVLEGLKEAEALPGVGVVVTAADLPGQRNVTGIVPPLDELFFRENDVTAAGQLIALVGADTLEQAFFAARKIVVKYADGAPTPVITIAQAIEAKTAAPSNALRDLVLGDPEAAAKRDDLVTVEGVVRMNGAEHFYLEPTGAMAIPHDGGNELELHSSSQHTHQGQLYASRATGLPMHKITSRIKRIGGGFGGKETRVGWLCGAVAAAAHKCGRPVRLILDRSTDMLTQGTRHPFHVAYKLGATRDGKLQLLDVHYHNNTGWSKDLGFGVMDRALFHATNCYAVPNVHAKGSVMLTNTATNTAFRGFGAPQAMLPIEIAMDALAAKLGMDGATLREKNFFPEGHVTHFEQRIERNLVPELWRKLHDAEHGDLARRLAQVDDFNSKNRYVKRGLAALPTMFGISFGVPHMNQGGATVNIYTDGTVRVSHGGVEIGQGIHTKVVQVVATALGVPVDLVHIAETNTDVIPNSMPTAASASFDMYGAAALDACEQLEKRLRPFLPENWLTGAVPERERQGHFVQAVLKAHFAKIDLCAHGFYKNEHGYRWEKPVGERGQVFAYFTQGVAAAEVELDTLTGDMRVLRADILMDLGVSPSPGIDIGQIEGAVIQGMGYYTIEETVWGSTDEHTWLKPGQCFTRGPGAYKIPAFNDVPVDMRVTILADAPNPRALHSSKAVGEPPLFLGATALFAARKAAFAARDQGHVATAAEMASLDAPLTAERLRLLCHDDTARYFKEYVVAQGGNANPALFC